MSEIYKSAKTNLKRQINIEEKKDFKFPDSDNQQAYNTKTSGYVQDVATTIIADIAVKANCKIHIISPKGSFVNKVQVLFKTEKNVEDKILDRIYENFDFSRNEYVEDNYVLAFKQLTEIALKAMSPGINDPETTLNSIDYLSELLLLRVQKEDVIITFKDDKPFILLNSITFEKLLYQVMLSLRTYCKHDAILMKKMLEMLKNLLHKCEIETYSSSIKIEVENLLIDAKEAIKNERDLKILQNAVE